MTFSILARCARTGQMGLAVASYSIAIGLYTESALRPNVGATFTQGNANPRNNRLALALLAQGHAPQHALRELAGSDPDFAYRQVGIVDREGKAEVHSGAKLRAWTGHRTGPGYAALGEGLAGAQVLDAMAAAFDAVSQPDLDERLLRALEAGRDAGGLAGKAGRLPERSAALVVWGARDVSDLDLRVDLHDKAIDDLRRIYVDTKPTVAYYDERARDPRNAISGTEFTNRLKQRRAQGVA